MRTRKVLILLLFGWWMFTVGSAQDTLQLLTFEEALITLKEQNPALEQARQHIKQREYELKARRGLYAPRVSVGAKAVAMSEALHLDLSPVSDAITPLYETLGAYGEFSGVPNPDPATRQMLPVLPDDISTQAVREQLLTAGEEIAGSEWDILLQEKTFATVTADVMWPILTGGKIYGANKAALVEVEISNEELRTIEGVLINELVTRYYGLVLGYQVVEVREHMLEAMKQHHTNAQKLFENGMIAKVELLHASVSMKEAERNLKQANRNMAIIQSGLAATLMLDSTVQVRPVDRLFINDSIGSLQGWIEKALILNPQLNQLQGKKALVDIHSKVSKASYLPSMAVVGTYNLAEKDLSPHLPEWMVGVGMQWTITHGLARHHKVKASVSMEQQVLSAELKAQADLTAYVTKLYQELQMQVEQLNELETTLALANEYRASTEKAFSEGFATSVSVVEANTKVAQVKALRLKVFYDYDVTLARFLQATGTPELFEPLSRSNTSINESI